MRVGEVQTRRNTVIGVPHIVLQVRDPMLISVLLHQGTIPKGTEKSYVFALNSNATLFHLQSKIEKAYEGLLREKQLLFWNERCLNSANTRLRDFGLQEGHCVEVLLDEPKTRAKTVSFSVIGPSGKQQNNHPAEIHMYTTGFQIRTGRISRSITCACLSQPLSSS